MHINTGLSVAVLCLVLSAPMVFARADDDMVLIKTGHYTPLFKSKEGNNTITVEPFYIDRYLVTNQQFYQFTKRYPKWDKDNIKPIFSDVNYLKHFSTDIMDEIALQPVTNVSWFAARAYCHSLEKRLPTMNEWEYVAKASNDLADGSQDPEYRQEILDWYARPAIEKLPDVYTTQANYWNVYGMHGVVWELVDDFNTSLVTGESRGDTQLDKQLFCGAGAASSIDPGDYVAFMRYAMRSSYSAHYTIESLGFRCAKDSVEKQ
jgi:formylglycine-generating enzyme required for sulfatase activity